MTTARVYRAVRLTARGSALLFAGAQAASALGPRAAPASRRLYLAFMAVHAIHFTVVSTYARINGGRDLFPGGRSLSQAGGWRTVVSIYTLFAGLALTGWAAGGPLATTHPKIGTVGHAATRAHRSDVRRHLPRTAHPIIVVRGTRHRRGRGGGGQHPDPTAGGAADGRQGRIEDLARHLHTFDTAVTQHHGGTAVLDRGRSQMQGGPRGAPAPVVQRSTVGLWTKMGL